jgi:hypothetical protein
MDEDLKAHLDAMEARLVGLIADEVGTLHIQITKAEERIVERIEAIDARQRRDAGLTTTLMELPVRQTRWHEQSDNAVADLAAKHAEMSRKLEDLRGRQ